MRTSARGFTVTCPHCRAQFMIGGYSPGMIRCGKCQRVFNLR